MSTAITQGFRLSPQQKRLWRLRQHGDVYFTQGIILLQGELCADDLRRALDQTVARHEIFRTLFLTLPGVDFPVQAIADEPAYGFASVDLSDSPSAARGALINQRVLADKSDGFDFESGPLGRYTLFKLTADRHALLVTLPALCADTDTLKNFVRELCGCYEAGRSGGGPSDEVTQYADLSEWQNELLESEATAAGRAFWQDKDLSALENLRLPSGSPDAAGLPFAPRMFHAPPAPHLSAGVNALAREQETSAEALLLACWQALAWRLTGADELCVGVSTPHRKYDELKEACGPLSKTLPLESSLDRTTTFVGLQRQTHERLRELVKWEEFFSWEQASEATGAGTLLFPFSFSYEEFPASCSARGVTFSLHRLYTCSDRYQIKLVCQSSDQALMLEWHYDASVFGVEEIKRLSAMYQKLLGEALARPDGAVAGFDILGDDERRRLLFDFNETDAALPADACLHELFERLAGQSPHSTAVIFDHQQVTYGELNARANRLARRLRLRGVGPETLVGVCVERSAEMVVSLLAVLKAGGAYVPLDAALPKARLAHILEDAGITLLLTQRTLTERLAEHRAELVSVEEDARQEGAGGDENPEKVCGPENLAYAIYTSGSTGWPKGVMISHRAICNRILWGQTVYPLSPSDRVLQSASFGFDFSVWEIFAPLAAGACVVLPEPGGQADTAYLVKLIAEERVTTAHFVPTMLNLFLEEKGLETCQSLRRVFSGGEALSGVQQQRFHERLGAELYNQYGPTETTVDSTFYPCRADQVDANVPIGKPIANTRAYILDEELRPAPVGVAGQLHLGGAGLARGYLGRPDLTAEKFIPDPFSTKAGARLYRTGDLARFMPDGNIQFLGRVDHQVKLRGMRIELGEIEGQLCRHPAVRECAAAVREATPGDKRLVAYVVPQPGQESPTQAALHQFLLESMPEHMIPSAFVSLAALPLTPSGKVDRSALPAPVEAGLGPEETFVAPRTPMEEVMVKTWSQVLGRERVGVCDNFFALGGHSLMAMQLVSKVREAFRIELPLRALFDAPSIEQLCGIVEEMLVAKLEELSEEEALRLLAFDTQ